MKTDNTDRRVRRTRQLLSDALVSLMLEQPYHTISVQAILDRADVGRSTFYAHFQDKDALFQHGLERMLDSLSEHMDAEVKAAAESRIFPTHELFQHIQENHKLYRALVRVESVDPLLKHGRDILRKRIERGLQGIVLEGQSPSIPLPVLSYFLAGALITLLQWWLDNPTPYSPERIAEIFEQLALPGVLSVFEKAE